MSVDVESALMIELRALAGVPEGQTQFLLTRRGVQISVTYSGGSSSSITFSAAYGRYGARTGVVAAGYRTWSQPPRAPRPLQIELRRETAWNVKNKAAGIDREVQTWDPEFDKSVYIDTSAPDNAVSFVLSQQPARTAAITLLVQEQFGSITIDDSEGRITASLTTFVVVAPKPNRGAFLADTFATLVLNLPTIEGYGTKPVNVAKRAIIVLAITAAAGFLVQFFSSFALAPNGCVSHDSDGSSLNCVEVNGQNCCTPMLLGMLWGLPAGAFFGWLASRPFVGRSNSSTTRIAVLLLVFAITMESSCTITELVMW
ncbi:MAG: hypothetical protein IPK82_43360 [Polyangiaceae bacterium]|nr:hypothetical protein [Polyangiaceae bacterium]